MFELRARERADHLFPNAKPWLGARLAESIGTRRARFAYVHQHQRKISTLPSRPKPDEVPTDDFEEKQSPPTIVLSPPPLDEIVSDHGTRTLMAPSEILSATVKTRLVVDKMAQSGVNKPESVVSVRTPTRELPRRPRVDVETDSFTCDYCCLIFPASDFASEEQWQYDPHNTLC